MIEYETTGSLESKAPAFKGSVVYDLRDAVLFAQFIDKIGAAFNAAGGRMHGVKDDPTVVMSGKPVVRKNGIRFGRRRRVVDHVHLHSRGRETVDSAIKFLACRRPDSIVFCRGNTPLKGVVERGFWIGKKRLGRTIITALALCSVTGRTS